MIGEWGVMGVGGDGGDGREEREEDWKFNPKVVYKKKKR